MTEAIAAWDVLLAGIAIEAGLAVLAIRIIPALDALEARASTFWRSRTRSEKY